MRDRILQIIRDTGLSQSCENARAATYAALSGYWSAKATFSIREYSEAIPSLSLAAETHFRQFGRSLQALEPTHAGFVVGCLYTELLPDQWRSEHGIYFTPPLVADKLIEMVTTDGIDWAEARVLDPACGGGAFLAPIAKRKLQALAGANADKVRRCLSQTLKGYELDPFSGWISQVILDIVTLPYTTADQRLPWLVRQCDTLDQQPEGEYDLVIGNPPYARVKLSAAKRQRFRRSLFGHANLYGLFTDQVLHFLKPGGCVAFVTPTSFLAGQYFKNLRGLISAEAPPRAMCMISNRSGVFEGVLQETMLTIFRKSDRSPCRTEVLCFGEGEDISIQDVGSFLLPQDPTTPWLIPRQLADTHLIRSAQRLHHRLGDYGYSVHTGPLVWNRHKDQLRLRGGAQRYPLIWAESVTREGFEFRARRKNHAPYFEVLPKQEHLLSTQPCVLLQRTTSKEQDRRLVSAELPSAFIEAHGAAVVENHINMVRAWKPNNLSPKVLEALFNSNALDQIFRCINGSVAVSVFELSALPMPQPSAMSRLGAMISAGEGSLAVECYLEETYFKRTAAAL